MKNFIKISLLIFFFNTFFIPEKIFSQQTFVSVQLFYNELNPYGIWADHPDYGYVWMPSGYVDFVPYATNGYWIYTSFGWTWYSLYPWGWAPFHYGRWYFDSLYGWLWIPGHEWGPAWVVWVQSPGYYGWAPMMPGGGFGFSIANYPVNHWVFADENNLGYSNKYYYGHRSNTAAIVKNSRTIENTNEDKNRNVKFYSGPKVEDVQKFSGREIKSAVIHESDKPKQEFKNNEFTIFRPKVEKTTVGGKAPAPRNVKSIKEIKPAEKTVPASRDKTDVPVEKEKPPAKKEQPARAPVKERELPPQPKELPKMKPQKPQERPVPQEKVTPPVERKIHKPEQKEKISPPDEKKAPPQQKERPEIKKQQTPSPKKQPERKKAEILFS